MGLTYFWPKSLIRLLNTIMTVVVMILDNNRLTKFRRKGEVLDCRPVLKDGNIYPFLQEHMLYSLRGFPMFQQFFIYSAKGPYRAVLCQNQGCINLFSPAYCSQQNILGSTH